MSSNSNIKRFFIPLYLLCLAIGLTLLVAVSFSTNWMVIKTREDLDIQNITRQYFGENFTRGQHINLDKTFSFGLKRFCVTTYYEQLETTEKECHNIAVFKQNLERAGM